MFCLLFPARARCGHMADRARRAPTARGNRVGYRAVDVESESSDSDSDTDDLIRREVRQQQKLKKEQDNHLDLLNASVLRLGDMSKGISQELDTQGDMLDLLDEDMNTAQNQLDYVNRKTQELIKKTGGCKWCMVIVVLVILVFVLMTLIILF